MVGPVTHEILADQPDSVYIKWEEPQSPNGMIILYELHYKRLGDQEVSTPHTFDLSASALCV